MTSLHAHFSLAVPLRPHATRELLEEAIRPVFPTLNELPPAAGLSPSSNTYAWFQGDKLHLFHSMPVHANFERTGLDPMVRLLAPLAAQPFAITVSDCNLAEDAPPVISLTGGEENLLPQISPVSQLLTAALKAASQTNDSGMREELLKAVAVFCETRTTQAWAVEDVLERSQLDLSEWDGRAILERMRGIDETNDRETEDFRHFMDQTIEALFPEPIVAEREHWAAAG